MANTAVASGSAFVVFAGCSKDHDAAQKSAKLKEALNEMTSLAGKTRTGKRTPFGQQQDNRRAKSQKWLM